MYLKSLEIQGFKSFPDKTVVHFGNDITAIVGPNGSGKSNISDAISWVMGEQSSKALRGAKMEDVIFGGTQKRAQVGFAEASLILDNADGALRIETPEVMITRRYYRSGDSEYYINRQSARLRDINELFMDTGLGREGYANIGQGRIDEILSVKSTDRREVFEEAAGISKFRHRKEETERRLSNTQDNLVRIGDKISELEFQLEPLREQAEKAKKFLTLRDELKGLEVTVWLDSLTRLASVARKAEEDYNSATFILEQEHDNLNKLYHMTEQLGFQLHHQDVKIDAVRQSISDAENAVRRQDSEITVLQANLENNRLNAQRVRAELADQESRSGGIAEQINQNYTRIKALEQQKKQAEESLLAANLKHAELSQSADRVARELAAAMTEQTVAESDCAVRSSELLTLRMGAAEFANRRLTLLEACEEARQKLQEAQDARKQCGHNLDQARDDVTSANNTIGGYQLRMKSRQEKRDKLREQTAAMGVELNTAQYKLKMLREMEQEFEGFSKAVRIVMQESERGALRGVHGPVSKLIATDDEYAIAVEIALGSAMQHIVVASEEDGKAAINLLKRRDAGRATFLPLRTIQGRKIQETGVQDCQGFVGIASELVRFDAKYDPIVQNLLGRTVIADNLDSAIAIARKFSNRFRIVTLDGQVLNSGGSMTGGSVSRSAGILSRANEIARLEARQNQLAGKKQELERELAEATRAASEVEFQLTAVQGQLRQAEDEVLRLEGQIRQYDLLVEAATLKAATCRQELEAAETRQQDSAGRQAELEALIAQLEQTLTGLREKTENLTSDQTGLSQQASSLLEDITALRMEAAAADSERGSIQESIGQLKALEQAMQGDRASKENLAAQYDAESEGIQAQINQAQTVCRTLTEQLETVKESLNQALAERMQTEAKKTKAEKDAQDKNKDILLMERESARLEQRKATSELEEKQILDKLWDTYELTPSTAESEKVQVESISTASREITNLKRKIAALGTPNLGAIDEFARINERFEYLTGQRDDVLSAKQNLEEIIKSITTEMTEIFVREFARINEYFGKTFVEMFGGGKASLELDDPEDPLGCGIEIRVQPPGKQVKTITLLSGGEKAFVAIALYFAILRVRPTPFCLLDEIDAALDDNNVHRYASYLRRLCDKTQFIVITHRRGTMEEADVLYGVTMQEQGISTILHIDLGQMERQLGITN